MNARPATALDGGVPGGRENPRRRLLPGLLSVILILSLMVAAGVKLADPATLPVRHVGVAGSFTHLSPESLQRRAGGVVRGGFFNVNVEAVQRALLEEPWVRAVVVKRVWPDRITITVKEQEPVARWRDGGLVNADAEIFHPDPGTYPRDLPVVSAPDNAGAQVMEQLDRFREILPEGMAITALELSERRSWRLVLNGDLEVRLGRQSALERFRRFVAYFPLDAARFGEIRYVDMRYTNGFSVRWEPAYKPDLGKGQDDYGEKI